MEDRLKKDKEEVLVAVCLVTYNQEKYIGAAIESVLAQKTDFSVDIIIGNDCSTDGTLKVLNAYQKRYNNIIVLTNESNEGIVRNTISVFHYVFAHNYTYVAMLDGDDWWCDYKKLQMQVDFMENHLTYSMVYTRAATYNEKNKKWNHSYSCKKPQGDLFPTLIHNYPILNGTVLHRVSFLQNIDWDELIACNLLYFDYPTNVMMAAQGPVGYIDRETLVWRRGYSSVSAPKSMVRALQHADSQVAQGVFLAKKFPKTIYDMPMEIFENYRQQLYYTYGMGHKNYEVVHKAVQHINFPESMRKEIPASVWLNSKVMFLIYVYVVKKVKTCVQVLKRRT